VFQSFVVKNLLKFHQKP